MITNTATKQQQPPSFTPGYHRKSRCRDTRSRHSSEHAAIGRKSTATKLAKNISTRATPHRGILEKRESFKEILGDAASKSQPFSTIVVHNLDRFSRDSLESFTSKAILKRHKVRLISVQEPVVGSDAPEDAFMEHILVGMAEFYSKNLAREIRKGLTERIRQGFPVFRPPYGYRREVIEKREGQIRIRTISRPAVDDAAAGVVRKIFELCDRGVGYKETRTSSTTRAFEPRWESDLRATTFIGLYTIKLTSVYSNIISVNGTARSSR